MNNPSKWRFPEDLFGDAEHFDQMRRSERLCFRISQDYLKGDLFGESQPEVIAIQRLITLAREVKLVFVWPKHVVERVVSSLALFPLLSVAICLEDVIHEVEDQGKLNEIDWAPARLDLYKYKPTADMFSDSQIVVCADSRGYGTPKSLYTGTEGKLISTDDFESLVENLLKSHLHGVKVNESRKLMTGAIAVIITELFENTDRHGKLNLQGVPIKKNSIRGIIFKRVPLDSRKELSASMNSNGESSKSSEALEISIFDSGVGFYSSFTRNELDTSTELTYEWKVAHQCMERHFDPSMPEHRASHKHMGLYEVLRALNQVKGMLALRTGRLYGFREFLDGGFKMQMESRQSMTRPGMPKPVFLDVQKRFVTVPSSHEQLIGASVRVLIPLN